MFCSVWLSLNDDRPAIIVWSTNTLFLNEPDLLRAADARVVNDYRWPQLAAQMGVDYNRSRELLFDGSVCVTLAPMSSNEQDEICLESISTKKPNYSTERRKISVNLLWCSRRWVCNQVLK